MIIVSTPKKGESFSHIITEKKQGVNQTGQPK